VTYTAVPLREEDGRCSVFVPALSDCHTWGETLRHALEMVREATGGYIDVLREDGEPIAADRTDIALDMADAAEAIVHKVRVGEVAAVA